MRLTELWQTQNLNGRTFSLRYRYDQATLLIFHAILISVPRR